MLYAASISDWYYLSSHVMSIPVLFVFCAVTTVVRCMYIVAFTTQFFFYLIVVAFVVVSAS